jgi:hydrogenase expression/formation protein HypE
MSGDKVGLDLGSGGKAMRDFIAGRILPAFGNRLLAPLLDAGILPEGFALTTDSYVVDPPVFPGGDIGTLAVNGTVNDLVVSGAKPLYLSLGLILEEGLEWALLDRVLRSIRKAADAAGVRIVTGDTKVVRRGQGDGIYVNTSGVGRIVAHPAPRRIKAGDAVIVTGTLGEHSLAILAARGEFGFESPARSDCAPLIFLLPIWKSGALWMRDITRGGLATVLSELAENLPHPVLIEEAAVPLSRPVRAAAAILGIDPLYLACEGRAVIIAPAARAEAIVKKIAAHPLGRRARIIGRVGGGEGRAGELLLRTSAGGLRLLESLTSELLPRIC